MAVGRRDRFMNFPRECEVKHKQPCLGIELKLPIPIPSPNIVSLSVTPLFKDHGQIENARDLIDSCFPLGN